eukprot:TRINITY_DN8524_c0_g1_i1.p1 TRINITY_DN8524_c0_g1~~TRINITY_DN8524_c0_g1_i1.p1  ORF type:complete len:355 (+),score=67.10 TRINITY_DN8524_c0_g1_i1:68-1132(+)
MDGRGGPPADEHHEDHCEPFYLVRNDLPQAALPAPPPSTAHLVGGHIGTNIMSKYVERLLFRVVVQAAEAASAGSSLVASIASRLVSGTVQASAVQMQSCKQIVLLVPYVGEPVAETLLRDIGTAELEHVARQGVLSATQAGVTGSVLVTTSAFLVRQGLNTLWLAKGTLDQRQYTMKTTKNAVGCVGSLSGSAAGSAIGTALAPGIGTGVGAFLGATIGSTVCEFLAKRALQKPREGSDGVKSLEEAEAVTFVVGRVDSEESQDDGEQWELVDVVQPELGEDEPVSVSEEVEIRVVLLPQEEAVQFERELAEMAAAVAERCTSSSSSCSTTQPVSMAAKPDDTDERATGWVLL